MSEPDEDDFEDYEPDTPAELVTCDRCTGYGYIHPGDGREEAECPECNGEGVVEWCADPQRLPIVAVRRDATPPPLGAKPMSIEPSPVVTREDQDRATEIVEQMALKARDCWRGVYAMENELWKRVQQLRRMRDDVRMGDPITIAKVLREATDPPCVSCGRPRSVGCEDPTACGIAGGVG